MNCKCRSKQTKTYKQKSLLHSKHVIHLLVQSDGVGNFPFVQLNIKLTLNGYLMLKTEI